MKLRIFVAAFVGVVIFSLLLNMTFGVSKDGVYESELKLGSYSSGNLSNIVAIRDGVASLNIAGESVLMKAGETHVLKKDVEEGDRRIHPNNFQKNHSDYTGEVTLVEVNEDSVLIKTDVERTDRYYTFHISLTAMVSLLAAMLVYGIGSRKTEKE